MQVGVIVHLDEQITESMKKLYEMGFSNCQISCWNSDFFTEEMVQQVNQAVTTYPISISALWCGYPGPAVWNFMEGPITLGLVPPTYRFARAKVILQGAEFARKIHVTDVVTHVGFIPENPCDMDYAGLVAIIKHIALELKRNGQFFLFETGQETPVTLLRMIHDVGTNNLGINLDPANLLMYGKGNPVDALDVFGQYVRGIHGKDGEYPTDGYHLGLEKPLGQGRVHYPAFIKKLKEIGYDGAITIEREISGNDQIRDILEAKKLLESLL